MTYTRQGKTYTLGTNVRLSSKQSLFYDSSKIDNKKTTKFTTNTDKSVLNLKWQVGGVTKQYYRRNGSHSQLDKKGDENSSRRNEAHEHHHHHHHHHYHHLPVQHSATNDESLIQPTSAKTMTDTSSKATPEPVPYHYPYAYPPIPIYEQPIQQPVERSRQRSKPQRTTKKKLTPTTPVATTKPVIKQSDKSINLIRGTNTLKIEHHYVDSPDQAQKLINSLRRRGFVETGIKTAAIYTADKKN